MPWRSKHYLNASIYFVLGVIGLAMLPIATVSDGALRYQPCPRTFGR